MFEPNQSEPYRTEPNRIKRQDCGAWGDANSNFTETTFYQSSSWFDDDDWEMLWNDDGILYGQEMNAQPVYKRDWNDHKVINKVRLSTLL